jgi:hypothetical protein
MAMRALNPIHANARTKSDSTCARIWWRHARICGQQMLTANSLKSALRNLNQIASTSESGEVFNHRNGLEVEMFNKIASESEWEKISNMN